MLDILLAFVAEHSHNTVLGKAPGEITQQARLNLAFRLGRGGNIVEAKRA